jgi:hypothetical protein
MRFANLVGAASLMEYSVDFKLAQIALAPV